MYRSFTESIDEVFFGPSMLDVMIGRLTRQAAEFAGIVGTASNDEDLVSQALRATGKETPEDTLAQLPGDLKPLEGETSTSSFTSPICDLILAVFELDKKNNWLRRQAIVIILQQVFGDTVERYVPYLTKESSCANPYEGNFARLCLTFLMSLICFRTLIFLGMACGLTDVQSLLKSQGHLKKGPEQETRRIASLLPSCLVSHNYYLLFPKLILQYNRYCCQHDREIKCSPWGPSYLRSPSEPSLESAYCLHCSGRSACLLPKLLFIC